MKQNKQLVESAIIAGIAAALSMTAAFTNDANMLPNVGLENDVTAGVAGVLKGYEVETAKASESAVSLADAVVVSVTDKEVSLVGQAAEEKVSILSNKEDMVLVSLLDTADDTKEMNEEFTPEESEDFEVEEELILVAANEDVHSAEALTEEEIKWQSYLMADVEEAVNVRVEASSESALAGKLRKGDVAQVVEKGAEWTKITSGNLEGYVANEYCLYGEEALAYAKANCDTVAMVNTNGLRVRTEMNTESGVVTSLSMGSTITVNTQAEVEEGWVAVNYKGGTYYVSAEYVEVSLQTGTGVTVEEEAQAKAKAEAAAKEEAAKQKTSTGTKQKDPVEADVDDVTLLAAIIMCEAGETNYDSQLAVGAVVCNRVKSKSYPNSVSKVIYERGQFTPASSGVLAKQLKNGVSKQAKKAAKAALAGSDNTDGCLSFRSKSSGYSGTVIGGLVFF